MSIGSSPYVGVAFRSSFYLREAPQFRFVGFGLVDENGLIHAIESD